MLSLRLFLLILITLLCREVSWPGASGSLIRTWTATLGVCLGFGLLAKCFALNSLRFSNQPDFSEPLVDEWKNLLAERWSLHRDRLEAAWATCLPVTLLLSGWASSVQTWQIQGLPQCCSILLWFLPSLCAISFLEFTSAQVDEVLHESRLSTALIMRLRLGSLAGMMSCLAPVLMIAAVSDCLGMVELGWAETYSSLIASAVGLTMVGLLLPQLLNLWMGISKLEPSDLRDRVLSYLKILNIDVQLMWVSSQQRWAGAAIVGWLPKQRQLWLGDGLVDQLDDHETDMVVMHELAHVQRRHFLWRILPVMFAAATGSMVYAISYTLGIDATWTSLVQSIAIIASLAILLGGLSYFSRACELDADRYACQLGAQACDWCLANPSLAATTLASALCKLHPSGKENSSTWLHPSLSTRVNQLVNTTS